MKTLQAVPVRIQREAPFFVGLLVASILVSGCNVFSFDKPSGDAQLLSAARACFDNGDLDCASRDYQKLSSNDADVSTSEQAYVTLNQQSASMANLMQFVGDISDSGVGTAVTNFAERINSGAGYGVSQREAIWNAFYTYTQITDNANLSSFVRFVGALALTGEILAEVQATDSLLHQSDYVSNPSSCNSAGTSGCAAAAACADSSGVLSNTATPPIDQYTSGGTTTAGTLPSATQPSSDYLYQALESAVTALQTLGASGKFGNSLSTFNSILNITKNAGAGNSVSQSNVNQCFRYSLISFSIGN